MIDLGQVDRLLFYAVNQEGRNALFDGLMPFITSEANWRIPMLLTWLLLLVFGKSRGRVAALLVLPLILLSDQTSSHLLKHAFGRLRPCNALPDVHLLVGCSSSFSMPSSHATNIAAAACHFSLFYRRLTPLFALIAFAVGYSRIYCGVHYPSDVLVGFALGIACGFVIWYLYGLARGVRLRHSSLARPAARR